MPQINDFELGLVLKAAADKCLDDDVNEFMSLETDNVEIYPITENRVMSRLRARRVNGFQKAVRAASIILVSIFALSMCIQPIRAAFIGAIVTWYEDHVGIRYESSRDKYPDREVSFPAKLGYVPERLSIMLEKESGNNYTCYLENGENGLVCFSQFEDYEKELSISKQFLCEEMVFLRDGDVKAKLFIYDRGKYILVWKEKYMFTIMSENVELDELIKLAEGIE